MSYWLTSLLLVILLVSCGPTFYVVRHAEKETGSGADTKDPALSVTGKERAEVLKQTLKGKKISAIYSTNTNRTRSTAEPLRAHFNLVTEIYPSAPDEVFIERVLNSRKNVLIVGHSNTVDDLVNKLLGTVKIPADLPDSVYDNLFVIRKKGKRLLFENKKYGTPSP